MMGFVIFIHSVVCILLAVIILMQSGRGGGLTETFASAETIFGAKTNVFLVKATGVLATLFLMTCLSLAFFSSKQDKSLMSRRLQTPVENGGGSSNAVMDTKEPIENANENTTQTPPATNSVQ